MNLTAPRTFDTILDLILVTMQGNVRDSHRDGKTFTTKYNYDETMIFHVHETPTGYDIELNYARFFASFDELPIAKQLAYNLKSQYNNYFYKNLGTLTRMLRRVNDLLAMPNIINRITTTPNPKHFLTPTVTMEWNT